MNTDLPAFARQEVKISVNGPHNESVVPPERFLWKRKVYVMGPILYFSIFQAKASVYSFFTLNRDLTDSHTGSAPEARKGIGSPAAGAASTRPLGDIPGLSNAYSEGYGTEQLEVK